VAIINVDFFYSNNGLDAAANNLMSQTKLCILLLLYIANYSTKCDKLLFFAWEKLISYFFVNINTDKLLFNTEHL
jgi:hypothetical protein